MDWDLILQVLIATVAVGGWVFTFVRNGRREKEAYALFKQSTENMLKQQKIDSDMMFRQMSLRAEELADHCRRHSKEVADSITHVAVLQGDVRERLKAAEAIIYHGNTPR